MKYEKSAWLFDLHNLFKIRDGLTSEQAYRRIVDGIMEFDEVFEEGASPQNAYDDYWN